ncbi:MAG: four-carbon acid sugar kinase family protein [Lapillicoccus sp.]
MTTAETLFPSRPAPWPHGGMRAEVRRLHQEAGRRFVVLDDDPTGSQCVHDVDVLLDPDVPLDESLAEPGSTAFVLTNTRSMGVADAVRETERAAAAVDGVRRRLDEPVTVVSRGDSTLRGHVMAEVAALGAAQRRDTGVAYDGVVMVPAYPAAGRFTVDDIHYTIVGGRPVPVGETEFSRDASFGYASSNLRDYLVEKSGGTLSRESVVSLSLEQIRGGGPAAVADALSRVRGGTFVVVNALDGADLDVVALAMAQLTATGMSFGCRCAPAFVPSLIGLPRRGVLQADELVSPPGRAAHGLVVVGSHVGLTTRQVAAAQARGDLKSVELDVGLVGSPHELEDHVASVVADVTAGLATTDVLLYTSRALRRVDDPDASLAISREVSRAITDVVRGALAALPAWVVAKGGITSHDVAARALGMRRGRITGQLMPGMISVFSPVVAHPDAVGMPYVVFAGNVGDQETLADVVDVLAGRRAQVDPPAR